jgi:deferrochelatase/peroxidase EfeB
MMGRTLDGDPLVTHRPQEKCAATNEFGFAEHDMRGEGCPIGSHIRRGNPRDTLSADGKESWSNVNRHRILRRGRPYGVPGQPRGLMFIGLNADIERQFEFIQQNWINDAGFGELRHERDPIIGWRVGDDDTFTIPRPPLRQRVHGMQSFVTPRGGGYFFLPGLRALAYLAQP